MTGRQRRQLVELLLGGDRTGFDPLGGVEGAVDERATAALPELRRADHPARLRPRRDRHVQPHAEVHPLMPGLPAAPPLEDQPAPHLEPWVAAHLAGRTLPGFHRIWGNVARWQPQVDLRSG
jgi:hypothetical protein